MNRERGLGDARVVALSGFLPCDGSAPAATSGRFMGRLSFLGGGVAMVWAVLRDVREDETRVVLPHSGRRAGSTPPCVSKG